jgi:hypothetical protein
MLTTSVFFIQSMWILLNPSPEAPSPFGLARACFGNQHHCYSESPDYFHFISHFFLNLSGKKLMKIRTLSPTALALNFYSRIFKEKEIRAFSRKSIIVPWA